MNAVVDASSLIVLAKLDALWLLERALGVCAIVPEVEDETITQGLARGYRDAERIQTAITKRAIVVVSPTVDERKASRSLRRITTGLSEADCATLACAERRSLPLVIEDQRARKAAESRGVRCVIAQALPLHAYIDRRLSFGECDDLLTRIGLAMNTEPSFVRVMREAALEIERLRNKSAAKGES